MEAATHIDKSQSQVAGSEGIYPSVGESEEAAPRLEPFADTQTSAEPVALSGIVEAIQKAGHERKLLLAELRIALQSGRNDEALQLARRLCGLQR